MRLHGFLSFALILLSLAGCSSTGEKSLVDLNGDISKAVRYSDITVVNDLETIYSRVENGEKIALLIESASCSHCLEMEDAFVEAIKETKIEINSIHYDGVEEHFAEYVGKINALQRKYGKEEKDGGISGATPSLYILDDAKAKFISDVNSKCDAKKIMNILKREFEHSPIVHFSKFDNFTAFCFDFDGLSYLNPSNSYSSFYYESIREKIIGSDKQFACFDYYKANEEDKAKAISYFELKEAKEALKKEATITIEGKEKEASELIASIYQIS